jgi:hypothetical protein
MAPGVDASLSKGFGDEVGRLLSLKEVECVSGGGSMKVEPGGFTTDSGSNGISSPAEAVSIVMWFVGLEFCRSV